jgi:predicted metalloenzyme YecM
MESHKIYFKNSWDIDHLCYRCASDDEYDQLKPYFLRFSDLLIESPVNGRMISTFKLHSPIHFKDWIIDLIELPAPKKGKPTKSGFEHIEVVCDEKLQDFALKFNPDLVNTKGLSKDYNQELELVFGDENIKFHNYSLESVIRLEKNSQVFSSIKNSGVLEKLRAFNPLVVGTFPLGLSVNNSDVDICVDFQNENDFISSVNSSLASFANFELAPTKINSGTAVIVKFSFENIHFEIIGQHMASCKQIAFQHFQIEEKILKYGQCHGEILNLRAQQGFKTEPAFAKHLCLVGDPYHELLELNKKSIAQLKTVIETIQ